MGGTTTKTVFRWMECEVSLWRDRVHLVRLTRPAHIDLPWAAGFTQAVASVGLSPKPCLVMVDGIRGIDADARRHLGHGQRAYAIPRVALVAGTPLAKMIGSFFIGLGDPRFSAQLFSDASEGMRWLLSPRTPTPHPPGRRRTPTPAIPVSPQPPR